MVVAAALFFVSLAGIIALFGLKEWEYREERVMAPRLRGTLDNGARACKDFLSMGEAQLVRLPSVTAHLLLKVLETGAIGFARLARTASEAAHQLADSVSHKRNFERREPRSEFLKQVIEHKNGLNGNGNGREKKPRKARQEVETEL